MPKPEKPQKIDTKTRKVVKFWVCVKGLCKFLQAVVGDDDFRVSVFGTFIITNLVYWTVGSIYSYFDITGTPQFLKKYKVCKKTDKILKLQQTTTLFSIL